MPVFSVKIEALVNALLVVYFLR